MYFVHRGIDKFRNTLINLCVHGCTKPYQCTKVSTQFNLTVHGLTGIGNNAIKHKVSREKTLMVFVDFKPHKFYQYPIVTVAL